jgi:hypothetical protein
MALAQASKELRALKLSVVLYTVIFALKLAAYGNGLIGKEIWLCLHIAIRWTAPW